MVIITLLTQVRKEKNGKVKPLSGHRTRYPETGSPVQQAPGHYPGQKFTSPFFPMYCQCEVGRSANNLYSANNDYYHTISRWTKNSNNNIVCIVHV